MNKKLLYLVMLCSFLATSQNIKHTVYFERNSSHPKDFNIEKIKEIIAHMDDTPIDSVAILGYSDYLGKQSYNKVLSHKRAQHVFDNIKKLQSQQLNTYFNDNTSIKGKGEIYSPLTSPKGIPEHRKVEIIFYKSPDKYVINKTNSIHVFNPEEGMKFNQVYVLEKVYFVGNEPELLEASMPELEAFYKQIKQIKTEFRLVIKGHICCLEEDATEDDKMFSRVLSTARALRIQDYLVKKGIPESYIEYQGYSFDDPLIYPELSDNDKQINRRVEAIVYK